MSAPSAWQAQRVAALAHATLESLRTEHGLVLETDEEAIAACAGEGVDAAGLIRRIVRAAMDARAMAAAAAGRMADLRVRKDRFEAHETAWRETALAALEALGLSRFADAEFSLSVSPGRPRLLISDPALLPPAMVKVVHTVTPLADAIKAALAAGETVPGAELSPAPPVLTVRSK